MSRPRTSPDAAGAPSHSPGNESASGDVEAAVLRVFAPHLAAPGRQRLWGVWRATLRLLRPLGAVSTGNVIEVIADGDRLFESMWEAIGGARERVVLNTYILEPDDVGRRTLAELEGAARRGCDVTLVFDSFGSHRLGAALLAPLRGAGARVLAYNPMLRRGSRLSRLVRNHWKILVVDDELGFCGGMNVAVEYAGARLGKSLFRDTHLRLEGPCVSDLAGLVDRLVQEMTGSAAKPRSRAAPRAGGSLVQILESNVRRDQRAIQKALRLTVAHSVEHCYLTTPYFVPPRRLFWALRRAARRGVDVRVLTAGVSDVPIVRLASESLYGRMLEAGLRVYEMRGKTLHAKTTTIDGVYASVGSFNLDHWSDRRNLEVTVSVLDADVAEEIEAGFRADLELSEEVKIERWRKRSLLRRLASWLAYQVVRL